MFYRSVVMILMCLCFFSGQSRAETIHYSIRQMGFDGEATLSMIGPRDYKEHKTVLIVFKAHGRNFSDEEDIYVDPLTYKPLFVERDFSLSYFGRGKTLEEYVPSKGEIIITKTEGKHVTQDIINKQGQVDNIYGFIYRYRREGSFKTGSEIKMILPTRDLKLQLVDRAVLNIDGKSYDSYYLQSQPVRYKIWFDTSADKLPLRITGTIGIMNSIMTMTGYEK